MQTEFAQIREQQKQTWNKFSPGWKKWDEPTMEFLNPMGEEIIRLLQPKDGDLVLDMAAGTGEPGLTIASKLKSGKVILADLSEGMLEIVEDHAAKRGIRNFETRVCDACDLPFPDNTFDSISCRFGFMFFPDMLLAAKEMHRVLKPGGKIAASVWNGPESNFWVTAMMNPLNENLQLMPPPPGSPGIFRCARKGMMADLFQQAGFKNISETEVKGMMKPGTIDQYWNYMTEVVAPVVAALSKADEIQKAKIKSDVYESLNQKYPGGRIAIDASAQVIHAEK